MKKIPFVSLLSLAFISLATARSADAPSDVAITPEARARFIREFHRIGLNTTPGDAMMLRILARANGARHGVEVGTATGYGAINMGLAFEANGGILETIDIDPRMVRVARENIRKMGLEKTVKVIEGDALQVLPALKGAYDFVFIDAVKRDYLKYFRAIEPKLQPGAVIVADNVIKFRAPMQDFLDYVGQNPNYEMVVIRASMEKGDGMAVIYKLR